MREARGKLFVHFISTGSSALNQEDVFRHDRHSFCFSCKPSLFSHVMRKFPRCTMTEQQVRRAKQSAVQDTFSLSITCTLQADLLTSSQIPWQNRKHVPKREETGGML